MTSLQTDIFGKTGKTFLIASGSLSGFASNARKTRADNQGASKASGIATLNPAGGLSDGAVNTDPLAKFVTHIRDHKSETRRSAAFPLHVPLDAEKPVLEA